MNEMKNLMKLFEGTRDGQVAQEVITDVSGQIEHIVSVVTTKLREVDRKATNEHDLRDELLATLTASGFDLNWYVVTQAMINSGVHPSRLK